jgi:hypothetical protein
MFAAAVFAVLAAVAAAVLEVADVAVEEETAVTMVYDSGELQKSTVQSERHTVSPNI